MMDDAGSLVRLLERAVRRGDPALLMIGGSGTVSVYPRQHCYVSDIHDWDSVYAARPEQIRVSPTAWLAPPPNGGAPLEELRWRAAYHSVRNDPAPGAGPTQDLVQLLFWPNLTRLPEELVEPVTRICALLWRKPTVGYLIARIVELPPGQASAVLGVLRMLGHVTWPRAAAAPPLAAAPAGPTEDAAPPRPASMAGKLWQRLLRF